MEGDARLVLGEDARLDRPEAGGPCAGDQRIHERPADAAIRGRPPRRRRSSRRPRDSTLAPTSSERAAQPSTRSPSVATRRCDVSCPASNSAHVGRRGLEGRLPRRDALGVDRLDRRPVLGCQRSDLDHELHIRLAPWSAGRRSTATGRSSTGTAGSTTSSRSSSASSTPTSCWLGYHRAGAEDPGGEPRRLLSRGADDRARAARRGDGAHAAGGRGQRSRPLAADVARVRGRAGRV